MWCKRVVKLTKFNNINNLIWTGYKIEFWAQTAPSNLLSKGIVSLCVETNGLQFRGKLSEIQKKFFGILKEKTNPFCVCILDCFCFAYISNPKIKDRLSWYVWYLFLQSHVEHYKPLVNSFIKHDQKNLIPRGLQFLFWSVLWTSRFW